ARTDRVSGIMRHSTLHRPSPRDRIAAQQVHPAPSSRRRDSTAAALLRTTSPDRDDHVPLLVSAVAFRSKWRAARAPIGTAAASSWVMFAGLRAMMPVSGRHVYSA